MRQATGTKTSIDAMKGEATRSRILAAAAKVLSEHGYSEARVSVIAREAGIQAPLIYYYFANRDALVTATLIEGHARVLSHVQDALARLPKSASAMDRILIAVDAHLRVELELSHFARAVIRSAGSASSQIQAELRPTARRYHESWRSLLIAARESGEVDQGLDLTFARMLIIGALNWAAEWFDDRGPVDPLIETATAMIRRGLRPGQ